MKPGPDWTEQARALLDASTRRLDASTLSRLNRARQRALDAAAAPRTALHWPRRLAIAASLLLAVAIWWPGSTPPAVATLSPEDAELLAEGELEMTDELEFYAWLDADGEHNG
ncbi:hypothetical protein [Tahibacter sp.]|uniref:hypothetical protein n=1 Tax=Tahibacter sp. TaxID=2056211 RepID=UPI0028C3EECC|nr:hypothetical protein [Tahibacter sp.]